MGCRDCEAALCRGIIDLVEHSHTDHQRELPGRASGLDSAHQLDAVRVQRGKELKSHTLCYHIDKVTWIHFPKKKEDPPFIFIQYPCSVSVSPNRFSHRCLQLSCLSLLTFRQEWADCSAPAWSPWVLMIVGPNVLKVQKEVGKSAPPPPPPQLQPFCGALGFRHVYKIWMLFCFSVLVLCVASGFRLKMCEPDKWSKSVFTLFLFLFHIIYYNTVWMYWKLCFHNEGCLDLFCRGNSVLRNLGLA